MKIPQARYNEVRELNVDEHEVSCKYSYWEDRFKKDPKILNKISRIKSCLGDQFGRSKVVSFYKSEKDLITRFLSAMIWGHEAPEGSRRDTRGPWKVQEMLKSADLSKTLACVKIDTEEEVKRSYSSLKKNIHRCGPSFLTKHLYFLGKSSVQQQYPLIFDDRVAVGLVRLGLRDAGCLDLVSIHALTRSSAYLQYLSFAREQAGLIGCDLDKIEYFLFKAGG